MQRSQQPEPAEARQVDQPGVVRTDEIYTLPEFQSRLGLNKHAMREARKNGLKTRRVGRRRYVIGKDVLAFLETCPVI